MKLKHVLKQKVTLQYIQQSKCAIRSKLIMSLLLSTLEVRKMVVGLMK